MCVRHIVLSWWVNRQVPLPPKQYLGCAFLFQTVVFVRVGTLCRRGRHCVEDRNPRATLAALAADVGVKVNSRDGAGAAASLRARNSDDGKRRPCVRSLGQSKSIGAYKIAGVEYLNNEKKFRDRENKSREWR